MWTNQCPLLVGWHFLKAAFLPGPVLLFCLPLGLFLHAVVGGLEVLPFPGAGGANTAPIPHVRRARLHVSPPKNCPQASWDRAFGLVGLWPKFVIPRGR